jgi:3-oxoadipate enol-lactonase
MWDSRLPDHCITGSSDTTVFLLHGIYGGKEYWQPLTERLVAHGFRTVAWDAPGYGAGPANPEFTLQSAALSCARLIGKTGTRRNILFGHSMGGSISLRTIPLIPGLISGFVMSCSSGYVAISRESFLGARQSDASSAEDVRRKNLDMVATMMAPGVSGDYVDLVKRVGAATSGQAVQTSVKAVGAATQEDAFAALAAIRIPSLFVAGEVDRTAPSDAIKANAARVPGSRFELIEGCGHYPWAEAPDAFWNQIEPFLRVFRSPLSATL